MTSIICKIIDERQFKYSHAFFDIDLSKITSLSKNDLLSDKTHNRIFSAFDKIETDNIFNKDNFYIVPIFYNHAEQLETLDIWKKHASTFIEDNKRFLSLPNIRLALYDPLETSRHFVETVEELSNKIDLNFLVVTANKKLRSKSKKIKVIYNDSWINRFSPRDKIIEFKPKKLYINFNRVARHHRCLLMDNIIDNGLITKGYNTWGDTYGAFSSYKFFVNPQTKIDKQNFDVLDIENLSSVNPNYFVPIDKCIDSFLFLNTETNVESDQLFFSEKVYKPIGIGMPFMTLGNPGSLEDLRSRGFITFSEWWDESYDLDLNIKQRIKIIITNLLKLSTYAEKDLIKIRKEMQEILEHNLDLYKLLKNKNWLRENLSLYFKGLK